MLGAGRAHKGSGMGLLMFFPLESLGPGVWAMLLQLVSWARCHSHAPSGALEPKATCSECVYVCGGGGTVDRAIVVVPCEVSLAHYFLSNNFYFLCIYYRK